MGRFIDLAGKNFGRLTVIKRTGTDRRGDPFWLCTCECGGAKIIRGSSLRKGLTTSCGCLTTMKNLIGKRYGKLVVISESGRSSDGHIQWLCKCDCGNEKVISSGGLSSGTSSCGCSVKLQSGEAEFNSIYKTYRRAAKNRNLEFALSKTQFRNIVIQDCYYCGSKPTPSQKKNFNGEFYSNGVDRIDNTVGYVLSNVVPCCKWCNFAKGSGTLQDFLEHIRLVYKKNFEK